MRSATWCAQFLWRLARFWERCFWDLAWLRRVLTKIMTFMPFERLLCSISGGSICLGTFCGICACDKSCQHLWDQERSFLGHVFATFWPNILQKKGPDRIDPVATKYYELDDETICTEQPTIAALQCIKNQLLTRSGCVYMARSLCAFFKQFSGQKKCIKRIGKRNFPLNRKTLFLSYFCTFLPFWRGGVQGGTDSHTHTHGRTRGATKLKKTRPGGRNKFPTNRTNSPRR